jgi:hypothetical protein
MKYLFRKKNIIISVLILDAAIGCLLFRSRLFSHLAAWSIVESDKKEDFYWDPGHAPEYFNFEQNEGNPGVFKKDISIAIGYEKDGFETILKTAQFVMNISSKSIKPYRRMKWDSPEKILKQVESGASPNCFYRAILFSEYLSGMGIKSRLWALENEKFDGIAHTVAEVYAEEFGRWVFFDTVFGFYAVDNDRPLSFLELRERLLSGKDVKVAGPGAMPDFYKNLVKCVFLRANNNFIVSYSNRYGVFSACGRCLDKLPDNVRRGLSYVMGKQRDIFVHYEDCYSKSLKQEIFIAKALFYFFVSSLVFIGFIFVMNFSKKHIRHR